MNKQKKSYIHLSFEERFTIEKLVHTNVSTRGIAKVLGRSPNTIGREIQSHGTRESYCAKKANHRAYLKRWRSKRQCLKVAMDSFLARFVERKLREKWSPQQISGFLDREYNITCSDKAIYKFVDSRGLEYLLFWSWNKRKTGPTRGTWGTSTDGRKYINERPLCDTVGHFELDFIVSRQSPSVLLVATDIVTKATLLQILPNRKHTTVCRALSVMFCDHSVKSITTDNDIAFNCWKILEGILDTNIYFTHPYCSWEKGLVENTNRWIRCFIPKKRDIASVTNEELYAIHSFINNRPRSVIDFRMPSEYYREVSGVLLEG